MELNVQKSSICFNGLEREAKQILIRSFPFNLLNFQKRFKYLGFVLKANGYRKRDSRWLEKIEAGINNWYNRYPSIVEN
jgi:hypothetical protein